MNRDLKLSGSAGRKGKPNQKQRPRLPLQQPTLPPQQPKPKPYRAKCNVLSVAKPIMLVMIKNVSLLPNVLPGSLFVNIRVAI
jgi:hypothetical protein